MHLEEDFFVRFWGVRGSIPCPSDSTLKYGGNTSTLEIRCGENILIFDAGSGIRSLGQCLLKEKKENIKLFLSHTHLDHICGFPFFGPAFVPSTNLEVWAGHLGSNYKIKDVLSSIMADPVWPVGIDIFQSKISFHDFKAGDALKPYSGVDIKTCLLDHTGGATGYRIEYEGKSVCYLTDTTHKPGIPNKNILQLINNSDLVIYDSMLTDEEFKLKPDWGHSTWQEGVRLCNLANVKQFCVFHHDPDHDDKFMDEVARQVSDKLPGSIVAEEGMIVVPGRGVISEAAS